MKRRKWKVTLWAIDRSRYLDTLLEVRKWAVIPLKDAKRLVDAVNDCRVTAISSGVSRSTAAALHRALLAVGATADITPADNGDIPT